MNLSILSTARFLTRTKLDAESTPPRGAPERVKGHPKPERVEGVHLQEQVAGLRQVCNKRLAAEVLAERLAESGPVSQAAPIFVP